MKCFCCFIYCSLEEMEIKNTAIPDNYSYDITVTDQNTVINQNLIIDPILNSPEKRKRKSITRRLYTKVWIKLYPGIITGYCKLCGVNEISLANTSSWEASHIIPFSKGGNETLDNLIPLCKNCNRRMGKKTVQEYTMEKYPSDYKKILGDLKISV